MSDRRSAISLSLHSPRSAEKIVFAGSGAIRAALAGIVALFATVSPARAQTGTSVPASHWASLQPSSTDNYWKRFALGFATSILAHETAHILSAVLMGY